MRCIWFVSKTLKAGYSQYDPIISLAFPTHILFFASFDVLFYYGARMNTIFGIQRIQKCTLFSKSSKNIVIVTTLHLLLDISGGIFQVLSIYLFVATTQCSLFKSRMHHCLSIYSRSFSWIEETVLKSLRKVSRSPAWWWSAFNRVLRSLLFVVSHRRGKSLAGTIKELSLEDVAGSLLIALRISWQYVLFICSSKFLLPYVQLSGGSLKESPTSWLSRCLTKLWRFCFL